MPDSPALQQRLADLLAQHHVVGASLAVYADGEVSTAAAGILNARSAQPATSDSVFQFGSITKVWTATLVLQLVAEGLVDLDAPVRTYLPDLVLGDEQLAAAVTVRHLLNHTSGIDGDYFPDTGRGDDCLERYLAGMAELSAAHPLGATMSYCNSGFVLLGLIVQRMRGGTWDQALRTHLSEPLGLVSTGTLPEEALLWPAATGHFVLPGMDSPMASPQWGLPRSAGPAGLLHGRASDLVSFARLHLDAGRTADGRQLLSAELVAAMQQPHVDVPDRWTFGSQIALGWMLYDWGRPVLGHDGSTIGQNAYLRVLPAHDGKPEIVIALCTNGGGASELAHDVFTEVTEEHGGAQLPALATPLDSARSLDASRFVGTYARQGMRHEVIEKDGGLAMVIHVEGAMAAALGGERLESPLAAFQDDVLLTRMPTMAGWVPAAFYALEDGSPYLHMAGRATPKS